VSVALFDLGQRLRAATVARPVARSTFAPVLPPIDPLAITVTGAGDGALLCAADGTRVTTATGSGALSALGELGVSIGAELRTLIIPDRDTPSRLLDLARATDPASPSAASAAVVGWWSQRADHPGSAAIFGDLDRCAFRLHAGLAYRDPLCPYLPSWSVPLQGLGIGQQLAWYRRNVGPTRRETPVMLFDSTCW
jgi:hypothetical protein